MYFHLTKKKIQIQNPNLLKKKPTDINFKLKYKQTTKNNKTTTLKLYKKLIPTLPLPN